MEEEPTADEQTAVGAGRSGEVSLRRRSLKMPLMSRAEQISTAVLSVLGVRNKALPPPAVRREKIPA